MAYTFDQIFAADPSNPSNVAQNASITIFAVGDGTMTPLTITDPDGQPLANPVPVNANGFGSAFAHATLDRVAWAGGGFTGFFTSYEGMKQVALDAQVAAETAAATAGTEAAAVADAAVASVIADADSAASSAATSAANALASATAAADAAALVGAPADTAIAAAINGTGTATEAALNATYANVRLAQPGNSVCLIGDSLVSAGLTNGGKDYATLAPWTWASQLLRKRLRVLKIAGISGQTTTQILARLNADVIALNPGWCIIEMGTNDIKNNVATATITANWQTALDTLRVAGIRTVALNIMPFSGWTAPQQAQVYAVNKWLDNYAAANPGVIVVDQHTPVLDPATNIMATENTYDGIHYSSIGAMRVALKLRDAIQNAAPLVDRMPTSGVAPGVIGPNPFMTGNVSGVATSWLVTKTSYSAASGDTLKTKVARTDGIPGEWQQVTVGPTDGNAMVYSRTTTGFTVGDTVKAMAEFETDLNWTAVTATRLCLRGMTDANAQTFQTSDGATTGAFPTAFQPRSGVWETPPFAIPANTTKLDLLAEFNLQGTVRVGRMFLVNLTTGGLAA